ncbi:hypothetical protein NITHO_2290006 [Nitrolancea hollandica Lb]|uniref:Uncharacterized protein n=1 Tax=Nitrolancea hollandica Lb TaxID=1129897 RepID=I4EFG6_9BACT|nr:hypothetical protein NITHO_2290006 [Nitrolancea hollandica Lb]
MEHLDIDIGVADS